MIGIADVITRVRRNFFGKSVVARRMVHELRKGLDVAFGEGVFMFTKVNDHEARVLMRGDLVQKLTVLDDASRSLGWLDVAMNERLSLPERTPNVYGPSAYGREPMWLWDEVHWRGWFAIEPQSRSARCVYQRCDHPQQDPSDPYCENHIRARLCTGMLVATMNEEIRETRTR